MPRILVTMPARNASRTIRAAIKSALRALPADATIAVWDDASEDRTADMAQSTGDRRVMVTRSESSIGSGAARQRLIAAHDSEYVANLDADDYWFPWHVEAAMRCLAHWDASFAPAVRFSRVPYLGRPSRIAVLRPSETPRALLFHNPLVHSSMVARRAAIESVGSYRTLRRGQDYDLWLRLARATLIGRHNIPSVGYRQSAGQISRSADYAVKISSDPQLQEAFLDLRADVEAQQKSLRGEVLSLTHLAAGMESRRNRLYYRRLATRVSSSSVS
jgi:hypothetical protein